MTTNNLATLCRVLGRYEEAKALYQRTLRIFGKAFDPTHRNLTTCQMNYAKLLRAMGSDGESFFLRGIPTNRRYYTLSWPQVQTAPSPNSFTTPGVEVAA